MKINLLFRKKIWANTLNNDHNEIVFVVANLFHNAIDIITDEKDRLDIAGIFLLAGEKAIASTAFKEAFLYLKAGIDLLGREAWKNQYDLALKLHDTASKAAHSAGKVEEMNQLINTILGNAKTALHLVKSYSLKIEYYNDKRKFEDAINTAQVILEKFGDNICFKPVTESDINRTKNLISGMTDEEVCAMKPMQDELAIACVRILNDITVSSYFSNPSLSRSVVIRTIQLSFAHGLSKYSANGFSAFGKIQCGRQGDDNVRIGFRFGQLGLKIAEKYKAKETLPGILNCFYILISPLCCSYHDSCDHLYKAYKIGNLVPIDQSSIFLTAVFCLIGLEVGSLLTCATSAACCLLSGFITNVRVDKLAQQCHEFNEVLPVKALMHSATCQTILNLESTEEYSVLSGEEFDYGSCFDISKKPYDVARASIICSMYSYLFADYSSALMFLNTCRPLREYISVNRLVA